MSRTDTTEQRRQRILGAIQRSGRLSAADDLDALVAEIQQLRDALAWIAANDERGWFGDRARAALAGTPNEDTESPFSGEPGKSSAAGGSWGLSGGTPSKDAR